MTNILGKSEKRFQLIIHIFLVLMALAAILPVWVLVAGSITGEQELILEGYSLIPKTFSMDAYKYLLNKASEIFRAYGITVFITVVGTAVSLFITPLLAYPLSRKDFKARNIFSFLVFFTMLFNGGIGHASERLSFGDMAFFANSGVELSEEFAIESQNHKTGQ